ncbi:metal-sulfur cluster assembly factor [Devosia sp. XJ19-1]|uniref:Metal-sulfur cluster assembly factor n=2 Tax=Devosia ureilytica TaxID=2952754 RepID=A0A9Q4APQ5_9HYPH|nr:metal-sulfur cluster assembly factor [Devosia ureilytica]MCP8884471.1 metal-sulfur cluster assembly factor [Devosia ureilytica]MCP8888079.1 metal-sulfur cluster assembly factor [Devosia ureilytica]
MPTPKMEIEADIRAALRSVIDPELGHNIIDLGMVYDVDVQDAGVVGVVMTTTARFCPASAFLQEAVAAAAGAVTGVTRVDVELTYDPPWTPDRMAPEIAVRF